MYSTVEQGGQVISNDLSMLVSPDGGGGGGGGQDLSDYQKKNDRNLQTTAKTVVGAINENKNDIDKIEEDEVNFLKTKGFVSDVAPAADLREGLLWFESNNFPSVFPVQVKTYTNGAWSSTTSEYTPVKEDIWLGKDQKFYYYSGTAWTKIGGGDSSVSVDDVTIEENNLQQIQLKDSGITFSKLNSNLVSTSVENENAKILRTDAAYKELLNNTNSTFEYDDTDTTKDVINLELQNNNGDVKIDKIIDFNDKLVFEDKAQTISHKTLGTDLDVNGMQLLNATLEKLNGEPASTWAGRLFYNIATDKIGYYNNASEYKEIDTEIIDVNTLPTTDIKANSFYRYQNEIYQYVNNNWKQVGIQPIIDVNALPTTDIQTNLFYRYQNEIYQYVNNNWKQVGTQPIIDVNALPTSDIKENVFYRTNNADKYFTYDNQKYQDSSVVCYKCDGTYAYADGTHLNIELTPENVVSYLWDAVDDTLINDLLSQEISGVHPVEIVSFDNCQTTVDYFIKYDTNKYDSASNFTKQTDYTSQLQYYKNNEWNIVDNLQIDSIKLTPTTTRADLKLIGEEDIIKNSDFETPKANGFDIVLNTGTSENPDIINDDPAYKYAENKTSSNNYINTRLETIERKADAKTITKFVDALPVNPDINTEYYVSAGTNNYDRYFVDSLGNVRNLGSTQMDVSTLATKQEVNLKQDISNLTTTLNVNSTDAEYPSAKAVYDNCAPIDGTYAHANNSVSTFADDCVFDFHYKSSNDRASETKLFSNARIVHPISRSGLIYGSLMATQTLKTSATVVFIQEFTESINSNTSGLLYFRRVGVLENAGWNLVVSNKTNIVWQDWQPVNYNYTKKGYSSAFNLDVCFWNVSVDGTDSINSERRMLTNVSFTCPITNTTKFYRVETTIDNNGTTTSGRASVITQIATRITSAGVTSPEVLKRVGLLSYDATNVPDVSKVYTYRNQIVWQPWYPLEYPATNLTIEDNILSQTPEIFSYSITGGIMTINMFGIKKVADKTTISIVAYLPKIPFKITSIPTQSNASYLSGILKATNEASTAYIQVYQPHSINDARRLYFNLNTFTNNTRYDGQLIVPLGY